MSLRVIRLHENRKELQRMVRRTMRAVDQSKELLRQTRILLKQSEALLTIRIKRLDNRVERSFQ